MDKERLEYLIQNFVNYMIEEYGSMSQDEIETMFKVNFAFNQKELDYFGISNLDEEGGEDNA